MIESSMEAKAEEEMSETIPDNAKEESMSTATEYWMVHRSGEQSRPTTAIHYDYPAAFAEAERLARKHGTSFSILHTIVAVEAHTEIRVRVIGGLRRDHGETCEVCGDEPGLPPGRCLCSEPESSEPEPVAVWCPNCGDDPGGCGVCRGSGQGMPRKVI